MALLFMDGFEQYNNTADMAAAKYSSTNASPGKWHASVGGTINSTVFKTTQAGGVSKSYEATTSSNHYLSLSIPETSEIYVGFNFRSSTVNSTKVIMNLTSAATGSNASPGLRLSYNINGALFVQRMNNNTILFTTLNNTIIANEWYYIEIKAVFGATGSVEVRVEGLSVGSATSVDTTGGITGSGYPYVKLAGESCCGGTHYFDDFYVCDNTGTVNNTWLGACSVHTLFPDANGTTNMMTAQGAASNWDCVNDTTWDTTTYVKTSATNDIDYYNVQNLPVTPSAVYGVAIGNLSAKGTHALRQMRNKAKVGASVTNGVTSQELLYLNYLRSEDILEKQPDGNDWTEAAVNSLEAGIESL